ncbi:hypothetical protein [Sulfitobacter sp. CW3]|uniref:hypothetical protein n=1 Tax=Sulfitobacter sp. CW3 TaxID=2861965 RepID=UPI001C5EB10C|nr:hypothetical protein [Sulfitobacter sp. CW3]MBW4961618.1 hypothetical protein [Sulfitobacter sp. CW3]
MGQPKVFGHFRQQRRIGLYQGATAHDLGAAEPDGGEVVAVKAWQVYPAGIPR